MLPLRVCCVCRLKAFTIEDLDNFTKDKRAPYKRQNRCKKCTNKYNSKWKKDNCYRVVNTKTRKKILGGFKKPLICYFCDKPIIKLGSRNKDSLIIHSLDGNHHNWNPTNKVPTHWGCHSTHHGTTRIGHKLSSHIKQKISKTLTGRFRGKNHPNWKGENAKESSKKHREWREKTRKRTYQT